MINIDVAEQKMHFDDLTITLITDISLSTGSGPDVVSCIKPVGVSNNNSSSTGTNNISNASLQAQQKPPAPAAQNAPALSTGDEFRPHLPSRELVCSPSARLPARGSSRSYRSPSSTFAEDDDDENSDSAHVKSTGDQNGRSNLDPLPASERNDRARD